MKRRTQEEMFDLMLPGCVSGGPSKRRAGAFCQGRTPCVLLPGVRGKNGEAHS